MRRGTAHAEPFEETAVAAKLDAHIADNLRELGYGE